MTTFLALFRAGHDTATIAKMTGEPEHLVYNALHREKLGEIDQSLARMPWRDKKLRQYAGFERGKA